MTSGPTVSRLSKDYQGLPCYPSRAQTAKPVVEPVYVSIFADIDEEEGIPYTLPPADQSEQLPPNEIMSHIYSFASKGALERCMETSQLQFELAVKRLYRKIKSYGSIFDPLSNPLFREQTGFRGCTGAAIRRDLYRRAVRSVAFNKVEESRFAGQPAFDRLQKHFPALSQVKWIAGFNNYTIRKDNQGSWSNLLLSLSCPDGFSQLDSTRYIASLTAASGITLTSLDYTDPIEGFEPLNEFISKLAKHCKRLRNLSISPEEELGNPPIKMYRGLFPKTLKKLDLPDAQPWNIEIVLSWNLPRLRDLTFELKGSHMKDLDWLKPKATRTTKCASLQSVRFDGFARYSHDLDGSTKAIDPCDMALWLCRTLPPQCRLTVNKTAIPGGEEDWARQVEERYLEQRRLERERPSAAR